MKRNTATQLLKLLSEDELRRLSKFLRSPYFTYSPSVVTLFECLRKWHPDYEVKRIRPRIHWKKIFPEKPFNEQGYWKLNFKLRRLIERFLVIEKTEGDEMAFKKQLIKSYADRNAYALFENDTKCLIEKINNQPWQDIHSYSEMLWLKHDYFFNPSTNKYGGAIYSVEDAMGELDRFCSLAKLRFAAEIKNREKIFSKKYDIQFLEEVINVCKKYEQRNPAFLMYKKVLDLYVPEKAAAAFKEGKKLLENNFLFISQHDQNEILLNLRNYAIRQLNAGKKVFWKEIFELYKLGLELELILVENKISVNAFGNIVKSGCEEGEHEWVEKFILEYEIYLDGHLREDAKAISFGTFYLYKKEYDQTISELSQHQFTQVLLQLDARVLLIKAWFYLFLFNADLYFFLHSMLATDERFIRRNKLIAVQKKSVHLNFILAVKKITEMIHKNTDQKIIKKNIEKYLSDKKIVASKAWLLEIVEEL